MPPVCGSVWRKRVKLQIGINSTKFYDENRNRLPHIILLKQQNPHTTGLSLSKMLERRLTFAETLTDPAFFTVPRQRLVMYRRAVWEQLAQVL